MSTAESFKIFLENIKVDKANTFSSRYEEITAALNKKFRNSSSKTDNSLQVGSYGRYTGIKGISDLDMIYIMPSSLWGTYKNSPSKLLDEVRKAISERYPSTSIKTDRLVVVISYTNFKIEVQPVFEHEDDVGLKYFSYPDTYYGGSFKKTKPRQEIQAFRELNLLRNKNLRKLCKMARAWRNKHGVIMGGLLIDTLAYNFFKDNTFFDDKSYASYSFMCRDFFKFLSEEKSKDYYLAPGSNQHVKVKKAFQNKAKKAYELCINAISASNESSENKLWKQLFGRYFPAQVQLRAGFENLSFENTEEFIEDLYPVDIKYHLKIDCDVLQKGFREHSLLHMLQRKIPLLRSKNLTFKIIQNETPQPYAVKWKVLNRGEEAQKRNMIRGQIIDDKGSYERKERTDFKGNHTVECYVIKDGVVVARDKISVPISWGTHEQE